MATTRMFTAEDLLAMGEDAPYELIMGELVEVSPASGGPSILGMYLGSRVVEYVAPKQLGLVFGADGGFYLTHGPDTIVAPDVAFVRMQRVPPDYDFASFFPGYPDLAVEVISPSNRPGEIQRRIDLYLSMGTSLVWVVYPRRRSVEVIRSDQNRRVLQVGDVLDGEDVIPGFRLPVAELFNVLPR